MLQWLILSLSSDELFILAHSLSMQVSSTFALFDWYALFSILDLMVGYLAVKCTINTLLCLLWKATTIELILTKVGSGYAQTLSLFEISKSLAQAGNHVRSPLYLKHRAIAFG